MKKNMLFKGQSLVTLLVFVLIAITITTGAIMLTISNSLSSSGLESGSRAYFAAESGAENALLKLLRDSSYTGETVTLGTDSATITVSGTGPYTIISSGRSGRFLRKIEVIVTYTPTTMTVSSWKEVF